MNGFGLGFKSSKSKHILVNNKCITVFSVKSFDHSFIKV